ncbi:MAG: DUF445 family protein [Firmicutes bacterium]|nr:DUF445 family protein [Bacillota bacterium]
MEYLHLLAGPVVGAIIGYFTNHIAVKMMFKPLEPVYIFGRQLPLTPGIIPKNKKRIARALGKAVSESLLTEKDLAAGFTKPDVKDKVVGLIYEKLNEEAFKAATAEELASEYIGEEKTKKAKKKINNALSEKISDAVAGLDIEGILQTVGIKAIMSKLQNSMLAMFINEETLQGFIGPIADSIRGWLHRHGKDKIKDITERETDRLYEMRVGDLLDIEGNEEHIKEMLGDLYEKAVEKMIPVIISEINIAQIVEEKIDAMDVGFLEDLLLSIIKTELDYVVRLGALIGFVIGCVNIFI